MNRKKQRTHMTPEKRKQLKLVEILHQLEEERGGQLTPYDVLDYARPEDSPIHHRFDWDDTQASEKYRLLQARVLINNVRVQYMGESREAYFNANVQIGESMTRAYFPIDRVMSEESIHRAVLSDAVHDLEHAQRKYDSLQEFRGLINQRKLKQVKEKHNL